MRYVSKFVAAAVLFVAFDGAPRADPFSALDSACGAAITNADCLDVASTFPEALGGAVGVLEAIKSQMNGADDCKSKLTGGIPLVQDALKYINIPGVPVGELIRCSCQITYSQATCTGEVGKIASDFADGVKGFVNALGGALGLGGGHNTTPEEFYQGFYEPFVNPSLTAAADQVQGVIAALDTVCNLFWGFVSSNGPQICAGFLQRFNGERQAKLDAIAKTHQAAEAAKEKQLEDQKAKEAAAQQAAAKEAAAKEAAKNAAIDAARKLAFGMAKINQAQFAKQCKDTKCLDDVAIVAWLYYLDFASAALKSSSNTAVISTMNVKYQPIFKVKVADSVKRDQVKQQDAKIKLTAAVAALKIKLANAQKISTDFSAFAQRKRIKDSRQLVHRVVAIRLKRPDVAR